MNFMNKKFLKTFILFCSYLLSTTADEKNVEKLLPDIDELVNSDISHEQLNSITPVQPDESDTFFLLPNISSQASSPLITPLTDNEPLQKLALANFNGSEIIYDALQDSYDAEKMSEVQGATFESRSGSSNKDIIMNVETTPIPFIFPYNTLRGIKDHYSASPATPTINVPQEYNKASLINLPLQELPYHVYKNGFNQHNITPNEQSHVPTFVPYIPREDCQTIYNKLSLDPSHSVHAISLINILEGINLHRHEDIHEVIQADKETAIALDKLYVSAVEVGIFAYDSGQSQLLQYFERLRECEVETGSSRTIYMKLVERGMIQSLRSDFARTVLSLDTVHKGGDVFSPHLLLDKDNNTILHLAAMSESQEVFDEVIKLQRLQSLLLEPSKRQCSLHWQYGAMEFQNTHGKKPADLVTSIGFRRHLMRSFRNLASFLKRRGCLYN